MNGKNIVMRNKISRVVKLVIGICLAFLSSAMLQAVLMANPDGVIIYVNKLAGSWEFWGDVVALLFCLILGIAFLGWQFIQMWKRN
jgi:hypothetical protein